MNRLYRIFRLPIVFSLLAFVLAGCAPPATAPEPSPEPTGPGWEITETLITEIDMYAVYSLSAASPDGRRFGYPTEVGPMMLMVVDGEKDKEFTAVWSPPIFSPDSQRVAYAAEQGKKQLLVVDGQEGKQYDGIVSGALVFSPDSRHIAYAAQQGDKTSVVMDGQAGQPYDGLIGGKGDKLLWDSPDQLHYLVGDGGSIYLVEERL